MPTDHTTPANRTLTPDGRLLFVTRCVRLFASGFLAVVLVLYLRDVGLSDGQVGLLLTLTLLGDTAVSLWLTTAADRLGRRRMLLAGSVLMALAGVLFALTDNFWLLLVAGTVGVISPSGNEVGPFLAVEHAALAQSVPGERRTAVFAWHNLVGSLGAAVASRTRIIQVDRYGLPRMSSARCSCASYTTRCPAMRSSSAQGSSSGSCR